MGAAEAFEQTYAECCASCEVEPCQLVVDAVREAEDVAIATTAAAAAAAAAEGDENGPSLSSMRLRADLVLRGNSLELFKRRLGASDVQALAAAVQQSGLLIDTLDLSFNNLNNLAMDAVVDLLLAGQVQRLDLTSNQVTRDGVEPLVAAIEGGSSLQQLVLASNPLEEAGGMVLARFLATNRSLRALDVGSTEQSTSSLVALAAAIGPDSPLEVLGLDNPRLFSLDDEVTVHLCDMLERSPALRELSLGKHGIRCSGATMLADCVTRSRTLRALRLRANEISFKGAQGLARLLLSRGCSLEELDLTANSIGDAGATAIGEALEYNESLRVLCLGSNCVEDAGLVAVGQGLAVNGSVRKVALWGNDFGPRAKRLFFNLVPRFAHLGVTSDLLPHVPPDWEPQSNDESKDEAPVHIARAP